MAAAPWDALKANVMASKMVMKMVSAMDLWKDETKEACWEKRDSDDVGLPAGAPEGLEDDWLLGIEEGARYG
eukprot:9836596-Ditylum_brightwellii.AAC.1